MPTPPVASLNRVALIVFEDRAAPGLLRWLRPGFRHCFCAVGTLGRWTVCDPLKGRTILDSIDDFSANELAGVWLGLGARVLLGPILDRQRQRLLAPFTCVEMVKSIVGIDLPTAITPFQLWRALLVGEFGFCAIEQVDDPSF